MLAFHGIFTAYGFWLPNDPRGSWSSWVGAWNLFRYGGGATTVDTRRSIAAKPHDAQRRLAAKDELKYPPVLFNDLQIHAIGAGFAVAARTYRYTIHACAILPDHVHLVIAATEKAPRRMIGEFKRKATDALFNTDLHPLAAFSAADGLPCCWAEHGWTVYLDTLEEVHRAIRYVQGNPMKEGRCAQTWSFVVPAPR